MVITIIALLIAIILPVLSSARTRARYIKWAAYSQNLRADPRLIAYWNFEQQSDHHNLLWNRAIGNPMIVSDFNPTDSTYDQVQPAIYYPQDDEPFFLVSNSPSYRKEFDARRPAGTSNALPWTHGRWPSKGAITFDNATDLEVPNHPDLNMGTGDFSLVAWVKPDHLYGGNIVKKMGALPFRSGTYGFSLSFASQWTKFEVDSYPVSAQLLGNPIYVTNDWVFVVGTKKNKANNTELRLYIDGVLRLSHEMGLSQRDVDNDGPVLIGGEGLEGVIDEVAIFTRALEPHEVQRMYEIGAPSHSGSKTRKDDQPWAYSGQ